MQRILSFDIGIKNLAYCFLSNVPNENADIKSDDVILDWRVIDLMQHPEIPPSSLPTARCTCSVGNIPKKKQSTVVPRVCGKVAKFTHTGTQDFYCETHAKSHSTPTNGWLIPKKVFERSQLNKLNRERLEALVLGYKIPVAASPKPTKKIYIDLLCEHFQRVCFQPICANGTNGANGTSAAPILNSKQTDLITLGRNMILHLDKQTMLHEQPPTHVILENQISTVASRMKTVQGELTMYFLMRFPEAHIEFISSKNKLKGFEPPTALSDASASLPMNQNAKYKQHKHDAVLYTQQWMNKHPKMKVWEPYMLESKKKDDLCDCFLQGMWYKNLQVS
uniref:Mitochondrial resolvase Ydc2 catalytic domain-containing protein n=1 Tax=viral metagenome TaxID=1070528 RepID=A0A6C0HUX2_9ZZZZ